MLILQAPIELKSAKPLIAPKEGFFERISGNYHILDSDVNGEDLLHVVTTPPEVYFGEDSSISILNNTNISQTQENHLEVLNNFLNRITVSADAELTYQDRVYLSTMLHKLGIRQEQKFLEKVYELKQETNNTNQLINLYWNHAQELREIVETYQSQNTDTTEVTEQIDQSQVLHLHQSIMDRLQTANIYQVVENFQQNQEAPTYISNEQLQISEQQTIARNVLLQRLQEEATGANTPLVYRTENVYEEQELTENQLTSTEVREQMTSAVLLDLTNRIYQTRQNLSLRGGDTWLHMENAFFRTAQNTLQRIRNNVENQIWVQHGTVSYTHQKNEIYQKAIENLTQIVEHPELVTLVQDQRTTYYGDQVQMTFPTAGEGEPLPEGEQVPSEVLLQNLRNTMNMTRQELNLQHQGGNTINTGNISSYEYREGDTDITYLSTERGEEAQPPIPEETRILVENLQNTLQTIAELNASEQNITQLQELLTKINQTNVENQQRFIQAFQQQLQEAPARKTGTNGAKRTQAAALTALEHPEQLEELLEADEEVETFAGNDLLQKAINALPQENRIFLEQLQFLIEQGVRPNEPQVMQELNMAGTKTPLQHPEQPEGMPYVDENGEPVLEGVMRDKDGRVLPTEKRIFLEQLQILIDQGIKPEEARQMLVQSMAGNGEYYRVPPTEMVQAREERPAVMEAELSEESGRILIQSLQPQMVTYVKNYLTTEQEVTRVLQEQVKQISTTVEEQNRTEENLVLTHVSNQPLQEITLAETEHLVERWTMQAQAADAGRVVTTAAPVAMTHKITETGLDEEIVEELLNRRQENRTELQETDVTTTATMVTHDRRENTSVINTTTTEHTDINEVVQRSVQKQLAGLSDQVYAKLERRLENEKKRRGL